MLKKTNDRIFQQLASWHGSSTGNHDWAPKSSIAAPTPHEETQDTPPTQILSAREEGKQNQMISFYMKQ